MPLSDDDMDWLSGKDEKPAAPVDNSPWAIFRDAYIESALHSPLGAEGVIRYGTRLGRDKERLNRVERALSEEFARKREARSKAPRDPRFSGQQKMLEKGIELVGGIFGGADPTYALGPGSTPIKRAGAQAGINAGVDAGSQAIEISRGVRDEYDPWSTLMNAAAGGVIQGGVELGRHIKEKNVSARLRNSGDFIMPVEGRMTSGVGKRTAPKAGASTNHGGIDLAVPVGTPVRASAEGTVTKVGRGHAKRGNWVEVDYGNGYTSRYLHLSGFKVKPGDTIGRGDIFARSGKTGNVTGPHLHWSMMKDGKVIDPRSARFGEARMAEGEAGSTGAPVRPMDPEDMARAMGDEEMEAVLRDDLYARGPFNDERDDEMVPGFIRGPRDFEELASRAKDDMDEISHPDMDDGVDLDLAMALRKEYYYTGKYDITDVYKLYFKDKDPGTIARVNQIRDIIKSEGWDAYRKVKNPSNVEQFPIVPRATALLDENRVVGDRMKEWEETRRRNDPDLDDILRRLDDPTDNYANNYFRLTDYEKRVADEFNTEADQMRRAFLDDFQGAVKDAGLPQLREIKAKKNTEKLETEERRILKQYEDHYWGARHLLDLIKKGESPITRGEAREIREESRVDELLETMDRQYKNSKLVPLGKDVLLDIKRVWDEIDALLSEDASVIGRPPAENTGYEKFTPYMDPKKAANDDVLDAMDLIDRTQAPKLPPMPGDEDFDIGNPKGYWGGPDKDPDKFAASVNTNRMKISDAAKNHLRTLAKDVSVTHQTHEQTKAQALGLIKTHGIEKLLTMKEMDPATVPAYNTAIRAIDAAAAENVAKLAKKIVDSEANPLQLSQFEDARILSAAAFERANDISGNAGRILDAMNIIVGDGRTNLSKSINSQIRNLTGNTLETTDIAKLIAQHAEQAGKIASESLKPKAEDYLMALWYNWRLSGIPTQAANTIGTLSHLFADMVSRTIALPLDKMTGGLSSASEIGSRMFGMLVGLKQAFTRLNDDKGSSPFALAFKYGTPLDMRGKTDQGRTFKGPITGLLEIPTRTMAAVDEIFRNIAAVSELYGSAMRQAIAEGLTGADLKERVDILIKSPSQEMEKSAVEYGRRMRFADDASPVTKKFESLRHTKKDDDWITRAIGLAARLILPFVHTLDRLTAASFRHSPLGMVDRVNRADVKKGGSDRNLAISRQLLGTGIVAAAAMAAMEGNLTGTGPVDYRKREEKQADGWQPYAMKTDEGYVSLKTLQPISTILGATATAVEQFKQDGNDKSFGDKLLRIIKGTTGAALSGAWTESLSQFFDTTDPRNTSAAANWVASMSDPSPTILRQINQRYIDTAERDTTGTGSFWDRVTGRWQASVPGLSDDLPQKHTVFGKPIDRKGAVGPDIASPLTFTPRSENEVVEEIQRLSGDKKTAIINPPRKEDMPAEDYQKLRKLSGEFFVSEFSELMSSGEYFMMDDNEKIVAAKKAMARARKLARGYMKEEADPWAFGDETPAFDPWKF